MIKKVLSLLTPSERKHAGLLMGMILVMAFLDMLGVASILPLIAVLANPEQIQTNALLKAAFSNSGLIGIQTTKQFMFALGVIVFFLLVTSLAFKALTFYAQIRFALMREYTISKRLVEGYLHQPYSWFLGRHSADLGKTALSEVGTVIGNCMFPLMTLVAQSAVALALLFLLILVDPFLSLIVGAGLASGYLVIFIILKRKLNLLGQARSESNEKRYTSLSEAFGAAKEVKLGGMEQIFIERFAKPAKIFAKSHAAARAIGELPRLALEAFAFGGMLIILLYLMTTGGGFEDALPVIGLYAFAGYRLLPALQQIYNAFVSMSFARSALEALHKDLNSLHITDDQQVDLSLLPLKREIRLEQVDFRYSNTFNPALKGVNVRIPVNATVGLVGVSGSGKTTLIDVILGLLTPEGGTLSIDGQQISSANRRRWQSGIGYVPQQIFLTDDTVSANIAFGVPVDEIDQESVKRVAKIANIHEFVENELPQTYSTKLGERGSRLSGGQRQRIGIARALYNNPQVLILDEATSALDNLTEAKVMKSVTNFNQDLTTIIIAHRLSTLKECDQIYLMESGEVKASGNYNELSTNNEKFAAMAKNRP